ncbi:MAG: hypothetical protein Q7O66_05220 [Dehalococcoidia bacterium]|nr:hypothetical protein [Dehalococcoidia bacterium]
MQIGNSIMSKRRGRTSEVGPGWDAMLCIRLAPSREARAAGGRGSATSALTIPRRQAGSTDDLSFP